MWQCSYDRPELGANNLHSRSQAQKKNLTSETD